MDDLFAIAKLLTDRLFYEGLPVGWAFA